jgi:hypothetical protein
MTYLPPMNGGRVNATIGGNTVGAGALISSGTLTLAGGNNVTLSQAGNAITISGAAGGLTNINVSGSNSSSNMSAIKFSNSNGVSFGLTTGSIITASHNGLTSQSNQALSAANGSFTFQTATFANSNGISFSTGTQGFYASHNGITSQTNQTLGINVTGNTLQTNSGTVDARSLTFNGLGGVSVGYSNGSVQISGGAGGGGGGVILYDGANSISSGTARFSNSNGISFGINGQTITGSVPSVSTLSATGAVSISTNGSIISIGAPAFSGGISNIGNTSGTSGTASNQIVFAGGNNITLNQATDTNGNTITIAGAGAGGGATLSRFIYPNAFQPLTNSGAANNLASFNYIALDQNVSASQFRVLVSVSASIHTSASTNSYALTAEVGVYTRNGSTISQMSNGSQTWSGTYSTNATALVAGVRELTVPMNIAISPGEYWFGLRMSSASTNASVGYSIYQVSSQQTAHLNPSIMGGAAANATQVLYPWHGVYSTGALPATVGLGQITGTGQSGTRAMYWFDLRTYTFY